MTVALLARCPICLIPLIPGGSHKCKEEEPKPGRLAAIWKGDDPKLDVWKKQ